MRFTCCFSLARHSLSQRCWSCLSFTWSLCTSSTSSFFLSKPFFSTSSFFLSTLRCFSCSWRTPGFNPFCHYFKIRQLCSWLTSSKHKYAGIYCKMTSMWLIPDCFGGTWWFGAEVSLPPGEGVSGLHDNYPGGLQQPVNTKRRHMNTLSYDLYNRNTVNLELGELLINQYLLTEHESLQILDKIY